MAATQYELLCRYYNVDMNMPITNLAKQTWVSSFDTMPNLPEHVQETFRFVNDNGIATEKAVQDLLIYGNNSSNPKFNMFFVYKNRDFQYYSQGNFPYMLMDKMQRIPVSPWFVHSTHASLTSVMTKARKLGNLIGHDNIKIGKVVALDQYIDIK